MCCNVIRYSQLVDNVCLLVRRRSNVRTMNQFSKFVEREGSHLCESEVHTGDVFPELCNRLLCTAIFIVTVAVIQLFSFRLLTLCYELRRTVTDEARFP